MWELRRWMSRLAFSFLIIAAVLAWQAWQLGHAGSDDQRWRAWLYGSGAVVSFVLFLVGLRARHARP